MHRKNAYQHYLKKGEVTALNVIKRIAERYKKLSTKDKIMSAAAAALTLAVMISAPAVAWFAHQRQIATMAKINAPAKISIRSGAAEDIIQFKMSGIDVKNGRSKDFVFCVETEDIGYYNLQLAHTTNINFTYTLYKARATDDDTKVAYEKEDRDIVYYEKLGEAVPVTAINESTYSGRKIGNDEYVDPSYKSTDKRQKFAEPLYWQTAEPADAEADDDDDTDSVKRNYYILEVSWDNTVVNDKETDLIYLTAQVA